MQSFFFFNLPEKFIWTDASHKPATGRNKAKPKARVPLAYSWTQQKTRVDSQTGEHVAGHRVNTRTEVFISCALLPFPVRT